LNVGGDTAATSVSSLNSDSVKRTRGQIRDLISIDDTNIDSLAIVGEAVPSST